MFTQSSRVTERKNPLSRSLDGSLSAERFLKVLQACDSQIYSGFEDYNSIFDNGIIYQMLRVSEMIAQMLTNGGLVISMGCGTSGRIAYMVSKRYQDLLKNTNIDYICAAGDSALLLSDEMPEDDIIWYPRVLLNDETLTGTFRFRGPKLLDYDVEAVERI